jgi:hypothetical protein
MGLGAALSNSIAGFIVDKAGFSAAFAFLAGCAFAAFLLLWIAMSETGDTKATPRAERDHSKAPAPARLRYDTVLRPNPRGCGHRHFRDDLFGCSDRAAARLSAGPGRRRAGRGEPDGGGRRSAARGGAKGDRLRYDHLAARRHDRRRQSAAFGVLQSRQWLGRHPRPVSDRAAHLDRAGLGNPLGVSSERYGLPGPDAARPRSRDPSEAQPCPLHARNRDGVECRQHRDNQR